MSLRKKIADVMVAAGFATLLAGASGASCNEAKIQEIPELIQLGKRISNIEYALKNEDQNKNKIEFEIPKMQGAYDSLIQQSKDLLEQEKAVLQSLYDSLKQQPKAKAIEDSNKEYMDKAKDYLPVAMAGTICCLGGLLLGYKQNKRRKEKNK